MLIDDLVTKGTNEPYRIMTSRTEYRLLCRQDNADRRLCPVGRAVGLVSEERYRRVLDKYAAVDREIKRLEGTGAAPLRLSTPCWRKEERPLPRDGARLGDLLRRPWWAMPIWPLDPDRPTLCAEVTEQVEIAPQVRGVHRAAAAPGGGDAEAGDPAAASRSGLYGHTGAAHRGPAEAG